MSLEWTIRTRDEQPPLHFLKGFPLFVISQIAEHVGHFVLINYYGFAGLSLYLIIVTAVMSLDPLASDSLGKNVQILRANGFADGYVLAAMVVNMVSSQTLTLIVINWICGQDAMASLWSSHIYTLQLLGRIIVNLAGTELLSMWLTSFFTKRGRTYT
ncbi:hypothetical protein BCR33DRAFT_860897 [Rhizoclosmatium globosum]|uniref:Uncharacterized protein n=1 Tax=Rhizoclosmatium globosum TaxID=329046 RepID=A0A1Y2ALH9_9FUNG|nr:hypothetical protein BCR33DRAFT_860897 [Rhizoclosmatium globosum]|eukprot:ORY23342.1 hypothetical protein BCR33DRAFT_860897 [Rhizoclosmatium globosum]